MTDYQLTGMQFSKAFSASRQLKTAGQKYFFRTIYISVKKP